MPITPNLIDPIRVEITKLPVAEIEQDEIWNTPKIVMNDARRELLLRSPKVVVWAQAYFTDFETLAPVATGSDATIRGYLIIQAATQKFHKFKDNDFVTKFFPRGQDEFSLLARIVKVVPRAQRGNFGLWRIDFEDDRSG